MKALFDTCIIIDALQKRTPFSEDAQTLFLKAARQDIDGFITAKSITDIYYIMHRYTHSNTESRQAINKLMTLFAVLDTQGTDCKAAVFSSISDYEDAVMIETAKRSQMDCIITRNLIDYQKADLPIFSPKAFLSHIDAN